MWDPETGGGFDGLLADGVNRNQGAESTLAAISTLQHARRFSDCAAMTSVRAGLVTRSPQRLAADPSRVITRLFVPGQEGFEHQESRAGAVLRRILALDEDEVRSSLDDVVTRFDGRHRDLVGTFRRHADELADRLDPDIKLSAVANVVAGSDIHQRVRHRGGGVVQSQHRGPPGSGGDGRGQPAIRDERAGHRGRAPVVHRVSDRRRRRRGRRHDRRSGSVRHASDGQVDAARRCRVPQ